MKTLNIAEAKHYFDASIMQSLHEPITVTDEQKGIAVILSPENFSQLLQVVKQNIIKAKPKTLIDFLGAGKAHSRFSSVKEIDAFVSNNREVWDN